MANGIIIIDKPAGWTSMDVCAKLRGILKTKKIGHAGTLDPMATGVLPVFVGQATRGVSFAESGEKEYVATLRLGLVTDTQDTSGRTLETHPVTVSMDDVAAALPRFTGDIEQIPPMYSAIKINGQKLYDLARQGREVERKPRAVIIHELELLEQLSDTDFTLRVRCSKGTYIRTLCHDIGQALGCGGCMASLRRTMAAGYTLAESHTIDEVQAQGEALLRRTENAKIFVEERPMVSNSQLCWLLEQLRAAAESNDTCRVTTCLHELVPTFRTPEEVNGAAIRAMEHKEVV